MRSCFFAVLLIVQLSALAQQKESFYDMEIPAVMKDSEAVNPDKAGNIIFLAQRVFTYNYTLSKNGRNYHYAVLQDERAKTDPAYQYVDWLAIPVDSIYQNPSVYPITAFQLSVYKGNTSPDQTKTKYEYLNNNKRVFLGERSTVTESPGRLIVQPAHSHGFIFTWFNPLPMVLLPLFPGKTWTQFFSVRNEDLKKAKIKYESADGLLHLNMEYKVIGEVNLNTRLGVMFCRKIEASASGALGTTFATFYFNEQWGFVKTEYRNLDGSELIYQLISVNDAEEMQK